MSDPKLKIGMGWMLRCCCCAVRFTFDEELLDLRYDDGGDFWCPNGHKQSFTKTETTRLKEKLEKAEAKHAKAMAAEVARADMANNRANGHERSARAYKGQATRIRNRIRMGVCPCCNRTFENVARHMLSQHPEWTEDS